MQKRAGGEELAGEVAANTNSKNHKFKLDVTAISEKDRRLETSRNISKWQEDEDEDEDDNQDWKHVNDDLVED